MNAADIPSTAADDIQEIPANKHGDFDADAIGEETEFADGSYYEGTGMGAGDEAWQEK